jgi:hypothetical protein
MSAGTKNSAVTDRRYRNFFARNRDLKRLGCRST